MKVLVAVVLFVAAAQAKSVNNLDDLPFIFPYAPLNPSHTAEEWDAIYAAAENFTTEDTTGLVPGTEPQPEDAGKVFVEPAERIIDGSVATQGQFPWHALLILGGSGLCGSSLISKEWVLTAAHCLIGYSSFQVTLGSTNRIQAQEGSVSQNSRQAISHANYSDRTYANDIGLVKLTTAVAVTNYINVVRLPGSDEKSKTFAGLSAVVSGYGRISSVNYTGSEVLLYINTQVITNAECASYFGSIVLASNICSLSSGGKSPCTGDSGGALVVQDGGRYTQVGVVSYLGEDCPPNSPTAYARVTSYLLWISSNSGIAF